MNWTGPVDYFQHGKVFFFFLSSRWYSIPKNFSYSLKNYSILLKKFYLYYPRNNEHLTQAIWGSLVIILIECFLIKFVALQLRRAKTDWSGCCQMALSLNLNFSFLNRILLLVISSSYPIGLMRLGGPRSRPYTTRKISRV